MGSQSESVSYVRRVSNTCFSASRLRYSFLMCFSASLLWAGVLQAEPHLICMVTSCLHVYIVVGELREVLSSTWLSTSGNANISSRPVRHRTEPMEPRRSGSVHLRMEMPVSIQRASETSRAREIDLAHAGFWYLGVVRPPRAGACAPTTLEPTVESGQTVEGGPRRCTLRTETTSPFGSCRSARKPISVRKFPTFLMHSVILNA